MTSATLLRSIELGLASRVADLGGRIEVASDPDHAVELLSLSPNGWRLILSFGGEEAVDPESSPGIVNWTLQSIVQAARGLAIDVHTHTPSTAGREPLLTLVDLVCSWVRGASGTHPDLHRHGFRKISSAWLPIDGLSTRQILLTHRCRIAIQDPIDTPLTFP